MRNRLSQSFNSFFVICETWQARAAGALLLALFNLFGKSALAAFLLGSIWFLLVWALKEANVRTWKLLCSAIALAVVMSIFWPSIKKGVDHPDLRDEFQKTETNPVQGIPIKISEGSIVTSDSVGIATSSTLASRPFYSPIKNSAIEMVSINPRSDDPNQLIMEIRNNDVPIPENSKVWLGIFQLESNPEEDFIFWMPTEDKIQINTGTSTQFGFRRPIEKTMFVTMAIESNVLKNGVGFDENHTAAFTWNFWKKKDDKNEWNWLPDKASFTKGEAPRVEKLINNFRACLDEHSTNRSYSSCFGREK